MVAIEDYGVDLDCFLLVGTESNQTTVWQWKKSGTVIVAGDRVKIGGNNTQSVLTYAKPITTDSAIYECTATNSFGSFARTVELRVKSKLKNVFICCYVYLRVNILCFFLSFFNLFLKGRAAPVWPFLGILGMASVLGLLIYFLDILPRSRLEKEEALKE